VVVFRDKTGSVPKSAPQTCSNLSLQTGYEASTTSQQRRPGRAASPLLVNIQYVDARGFQISHGEHQDKKMAVYPPRRPAVIVTTKRKDSPWTREYKLLTSEQIENLTNRSEYLHLDIYTQRICILEQICKCFHCVLLVKPQSLEKCPERYVIAFTARIRKG